MILFEKDKVKQEGAKISIDHEKLIRLLAQEQATRPEKVTPVEVEARKDEMRHLAGASYKELLEAHLDSAKNLQWMARHSQHSPQEYREGALIHKARAKALRNYLNRIGESKGRG